MSKQTATALNNSKYTVRKYQFGWIAKRRSDGMQVYFENYDELKQYVNS